MGPISTSNKSNSPVSAAGQPKIEAKDRRKSVTAVEQERRLRQIWDYEATELPSVQEWKTDELKDANRDAMPWWKWITPKRRQISQ